MKRIAVVLSGGVGSRMGLEIPKQYVVVGDRPIISYSVQQFLNNSLTDAIVIVVANEWRNFVEKHVSKLLPQKPVYYAEAGETRQYSVYNGLKVVSEYVNSPEDIVLIHDAARPLVSQDLINRCYTSCEEVDGVMPVVPVKDTTYLSEDGIHIQSLLNRNHLWSGQAPEAFRLVKYLKIHEDMPKEELLKINGSTELAFKVGLNCQMIEGDSMNFKITTPEDLSNFEAIIFQ